MITTVLCYSATSGIAVADCGKPCRVDMGNVGQNVLRQASSGTAAARERSGHFESHAPIIGCGEYVPLPIRI